MATAARSLEVKTANPSVFEVAWEVVNRGLLAGGVGWCFASGLSMSKQLLTLRLILSVGGIYTVIKTKAYETVKELGNDYWYAVALLR